MNNYEDKKALSKEGRPDLRINTLGRFSVTRKKVNLTADFGRTKKVWELFMYLISHRDKMIPPEVIAEALWPEEEYSNPKSSIKNLIHRLRQKLKATDYPLENSPVIFAQGCYGWNNDYPYWLDTEEFQTKYNEALTLAVSNPAAACRLFSEAVAIYKGQYLAENPYSDWIMPLRQLYHNKYINAAQNLTKALSEQNLYLKIIDSCEKIFLVEFFEEEFHLYYIDALLALNNISKARSHYEYTTALFYKELGVKPSSAMRQAYRKISEQAADLEKAGLSLEEVLSEKDKAKGPFLCKPGFFEFLCNLEKRRMEREERPIHLGFLTFDTHSLKDNSTQKTETVMELLRTIIIENLRKGDAYTPWKHDQYALLLPGADQEQAHDILKRITESFKNNNPNLTMDLLEKVHPLVPAEYL